VGVYQFRPLPWARCVRIVTSVLLFRRIGVGCRLLFLCVLLSLNATLVLFIVRVMPVESLLFFRFSYYCRFVFILVVCYFYCVLLLLLFSMFLVLIAFLFLCVVGLLFLLVLVLLL